LAAFLWTIDELLRRREESVPALHTLYISPLRALGYDIERNLHVPLNGIRELAKLSGLALPEIRIGVRTGDTSPSERARLIRRPPHILITTPESLHLMLTSVRARETLASTRTVIVDEVHALVDNKRGTFLALLLERLEDLCQRPFQRIGLSATICPLDPVARFLAGYAEKENGEFQERAVTVVDAGLRKELDLRVIAPVEDMTALPEGSIWPSIYARLHELILNHRSTIVFVNNRRTAERIAAELNELAGYELVQVHHGSVAKERRRELEEKLKAGELPAIVATASLELGIDMGLVDLVIQVESPHGVARGLQRVGRAGHLFRAPSRGRLIPKTRADLLEMAALSRAMHHADIEAIKIPKLALDILAQQIVAIVSTKGEIGVDELYRLVRRAYPFYDLPGDAFRNIVAMLCQPGSPWGLRPRLVWDRVHDLLYPLPGSRRLALIGGGAIPDTGQYGVYTEAGERIGELDEEFVYETRVGEVIVLGTNRWRIMEIDHDRVIVAPGEGLAKIPFWKGEAYGRGVHLGKHIGVLTREIEARLDDPTTVDWLREECNLDLAAAKNLVQYISDQLARSFVPTDRRLVIEGFPDEAGGLRLALLSPFGKRFHLALRLAILARFRQELGVHPDSLHADTGIIFRLTGIPFDRAMALIRGIMPEEVEGLVSAEVGGSTLFGLRFRENASRALLLPKQPGRRTPLWLKRLTARDLLELARAQPGFPIVTETYREILADFLPMDELRAWLAAIRTGEVEVAVRRAPAPSPFSASLLFEFQATYLYQWDEPKPGPVPIGLAEEELAAIIGRDLAPAVDRGVVARVEAELRGLFSLRTGAELLAYVEQRGDVAEEEILEKSSPEIQAALTAFLASGTLARLEFPKEAESCIRIVGAKNLAQYRKALSGDAMAQREIVRRHTAFRALVSLPEIQSRYPFPKEAIAAALDEPPFVAVTWHGERCWTRRDTLERLRQLTLTARRRRVRAHSPYALQAFLLRHQHRTPETFLTGPEGVAQVLSQLQGIALPWALWEKEVLPARVENFQALWVDDLIRSGEFLWLGRPGLGRDPVVMFLCRRDLAWLRKAYPPPVLGEFSEEEKAVCDRLTKRGPSFLMEIAQDLGMPAAKCALQLWELARAGLVTNDGLAPLRAGPPPAKPVKTGIWPGATGRWSIFPAPAKGLTEDEREKLVRLLLARYGVVSRQILAMDGAVVPWGELYAVLNRLEWRGAVARGLFVDGLAGAQFAQEEVLVRLGGTGMGWILISAADPAVLYGAGAPFPIAHPTDPEWRLRRIWGIFLILRDGSPVLAGEGFGERLTQVAELSESQLEEALSLLPELVKSGVRRLTVRTWNGQPVWGSPVEKILRTFGFQHSPDALILYRRYT
jgi:ATP-dependent Lhr-like helicase